MSLGDFLGKLVTAPIKAVTDSIERQVKDIVE